MSIGKNWWTVFLNLNFENICEELVVEEVTKIFFIFLFFSNFFIIGIMLNISPKLAPCIHTVFLFSGLFEKKQNFYLNLFGSSFPDKILIKKI